MKEAALGDVYPDMKPSATRSVEHEIARLQLLRTHTKPDTQLRFRGSWNFLIQIIAHHRLHERGTVDAIARGSTQAVRGTSPFLVRLHELLLDFRGAQGSGRRAGLPDHQEQQKNQFKSTHSVEWVKIR